MGIEEVPDLPQNTVEDDAIKFHTSTPTEDTNLDDSELGKTEDLFGSSSPLFFKEKGNDCYRDKNFREAIDWYTRALTRLEFSDNDVLRSQLFCNRAACYQALGDWEAAISDCTDALCFDEAYTKAYLRRSAAFEKTNSYQKSHSDLEKALSLDPSLEYVSFYLHFITFFSPKYSTKKAQLKKLADAEFESEKEQMIGKLKDLGNNLLGKIGLSLDNFKVQKNPETGSYNIQFQQ
ncbi:uncharacterized protein TOT_030000420 [Theileria orientalis strain Shintoku]|uniref:Uncharacterized protein n=1 Tax=Theileria orientalis strain Shintoku TaxID=869250 RepID=J4CDH6_THEOR|nr:uncharacterized protein TOT_030000420 [Theileria orientalis strain Shintoku]PVC52792.1 hypothetical protein MACL_00000552 [Theileria orientalis]BAM41157.1 uncharacterized protein TOT_030000420 [Theileria orientalis strain Shintoku]|eukprot:XP_009691458.1 uncharacterized protein TOT_030000420 [Theileria orientalis strain Shintoku]